MNRRVLFIAALWPLLTAGMCTTDREPVIRTVTVQVPTPVPCVPPSLRDPPAYASKKQLRELAGPDLRLQGLAEAYLLMDQWIREAAPVIRACR